MIDALIDDTPPEVQHGEREVEAFIENYTNRDVDAPICDMTETKKRIKAVKNQTSLREFHDNEI